MKTIKLIKSGNKILLFSCLVIFLFSIVSCARKIAFTTSDVVPAAEGSVKVKKDANKNYNVELNVIRLADPKRLNPPKKIYIVWMDTEMNGTKKIGRLNTSSGLFSSTLKSSLTTATPFKPTKFFITAEDDENATYPVGQIVLRTNSF